MGNMIAHACITPTHCSSSPCSLLTLVVRRRRPKEIEPLAHSHTVNEESSPEPRRLVPLRSLCSEPGPSMSIPHPSLTTGLLNLPYKGVGSHQLPHHDKVRTLACPHAKLKMQRSCSPCVPHFTKEVERAQRSWWSPAKEGLLCSLWPFPKGRSDPIAQMLQLRLRRVPGHTASGGCLYFKSRTPSGWGMLW